MQGTLILGIETSCDETAAAVVRNGRTILSSTVASQIATHSPYGGVVPELAGRKHLDNLVPVVTAAIDEADIPPSSLGAIAITSSPGLLGALLVGTSFAKALAMGWSLPIVEVNHLYAHALSLLLRQLIPCRLNSGIGSRHRLGGYACRPPYSATSCQYSTTRLAILILARSAMMVTGCALLFPVSCLMTMGIHDANPVVRVLRLITRAEQQVPGRRYGDEPDRREDDIPRGSSLCFRRT